MTCTPIPNPFPRMPGGDAEFIGDQCGLDRRRSTKTGEFIRHDCIWDDPFWVKTLDERAQTRALNAGDPFYMNSRFVRPTPPSHSTPPPAALA